MSKDNKTLVLEKFVDVCKKSVEIGSGERLGDVYKYWPILINKYDRPYHNFDHIYSGLCEIQFLTLFKSDQTVKYLNELILAWILHDINVGCRQAELLSAIFTQHLIYDLNIRINDEVVYDLIYETSPDCYMIAGPSKTGMYEADFIHDIDFLQFGQDWNTFLKCNDNIDKEFGDRLDPIARGKFLRILQNMNHIYRTDKYREKYEAKAFQNINRILKERYI